MKPPPPASRAGPCRLKARRKGSSRKKPKRLSSISPLGHRIVGQEAKDAAKRDLSSFLSPEMFHVGSKSPASFLTPPPFNLSFGPDLNNEVLLYMDKLDGSPTVSSTPLATSFSSRNSSHSQARSYNDLGKNASGVPLFEMNVSGVPLFDSSNACDLAHFSTPKPASCSSFMQTPARSANNNLSLAAWGLPEKVLEQYAKRGITTMFEWQAECLMLPNVLNGGNLVYSAPTSAGKTLVAELLALKCVLETKKKVFIILPFVSIAQEKSSYLQRIFEPVGVRVGGFMGSHAPSGGFAAVDIAICTIEKANSLVNRLLEENATHKLGAVIVDELHMVGDSHRGYLLELLLTKLMYVGRRGKVVITKQTSDESESHTPDFPQLGCQEACNTSDTNETAADPYKPSSIQLIGMSATLPNLDALAAWLSAELYHTDFRPVPLKEMVKLGTTLYDTGFLKIRELEKVEGVPEDEDEVILLCRETVLQGHSVLIFCPTKNWCEKLALAIAGACFLQRPNDSPPPLAPEGSTGTATVAKLDRAALLSVCEQLRRTQVGLDHVLEKTIPHGVAFHHAGLTFDEREIVEGAFRQALLRILVATSTLSAGVNLPARMVIIRTPFFQRNLIDVQVYKQMVGRAGRKGEDSEGESVLICKPSERSKVVDLLKSAPKPVESCLGQTKSIEKAKGVKENEMSAMKRALLEVVASRTANSTHEIEAYASCTLLFADMRRKVTVGRSPGRRKDPARCTRELIQSTLQFLVENEFITVRTPLMEAGGISSPGRTSPGCLQKDLEYYPTQLGVATVASALAPGEALIVFAELQRARRNFVLENELHIVYLVSPVYIQNQWPRIDWYKYLCLWERLPPGMKHVADTLGVQESFLAKAIQGRIPERTVAQRECLRVHQRFFTSLALHDLVHEVPIVEVARRYGATKGLLQTLQSAAGTFAGMVTVFCARLGWRNLELLLSQFQNRLTFGVERELCDLVRISLLNGFRARVLYNSGFHTLAAIATANPIAIETCLRNAVPFKSRKLEEAHGTCHTTWCAKLRKGMSEEEAAVSIIQEAQVILSDELKVPLSAWTKMERPLSGAVHPLPVRISDPPIVNGKPLLPNDGRCEANLQPASLRKGQRKSPSDDTTITHSEVKKPRLQVVPATVKETAGPSIQIIASEIDQGREPTPTRVTTSAGFGAHQKESRGSYSKEARSGEAEPRDHITLPTGFVPASTLLRKDCPRQLGAPRPLDSNLNSRGETNHQVLPLAENLSPIYKRSLQVKSPKRTTPAPLSPQSQPCLSPSGDPHELSMDHPLPIPDSMELSMSFGCQTLAEIDAACATVEEPCLEQQGGQERVELVGKNVEIDSASVGKTGTTAQVPVVHGVPEPNSSTSRQLGTDVTSKQNSHGRTGKSVPEIHPVPLQTSHLPLHPANDGSKPAARRGEGGAPNQPPGEVPATPISLRELSASLCSSQLSQSSGVTVIDVTASQVLFETFLSECLEQKLVSFSVATQMVNPETGIGSAIVSRTTENAGIPLANENEQVVGLAFCWGDTDVYYLSLCQEFPGDAIPLPSRVNAVRRIFSESSSREKLIAYDLKRHAKTLLVSCGVMPFGELMDPCVASWMLDPDAKEKTIHKMVLQYLPEQPTLSEDEDCEDMPLSSLATHATDPQIRASAEAVLAALLMSKLLPLLEAQNLYDPFIKVEMPSLLILAKLEFNGIGFSPDECTTQKEVLEARLLELERDAYGLALRSFSLTSPEDVAQVLFIELKLPSSLEEGELGKPHKTLGPHTRRGKKRLQHLSTAKEVLEKITHLHPLPGLILEWRRITSTVTKTVFPLFKDAVVHEGIKSVRIHPRCQIHTATGRVAMSDPSLQMVPKEYDIGSSYRPQLSPRNIPTFPTLNSAAANLLSESQAFNACLTSEHTDPFPPPRPRPRPSSVCMRNVFVAFPGGVFLAADYSQLELRILAHVSGDKKLQSFLNKEGDVFKMIAGEWLGVPPSEVSSKQRQEAKQVCYGMVYGIGAKALGKQLDISADDAAQFMESFKSKYPTMKKFLSKTVRDCRENGYVTTLLGRKRFLPSIHSSNVHARSQAERQAVNTAIQGSAADLVKTAMVNIDQRLDEVFSRSHLPLAEHVHETPRGSCTLTPPSGAYLVLQLHDELLYEVCETDLDQVTGIVQHEMENALRLSVQFPVKVKVGPSWGRLEDCKMPTV